MFLNSKFAENFPHGMMFLNKQGGKVGWIEVFH